MAKSILDHVGEPCDATSATFLAIRGNLMASVIFVFHVYFDIARVNKSSPLLLKSSCSTNERSKVHGRADAAP